MPTARYRLAAIDIDDTLVGPDKKVSEENRLAVQRLHASGCRVVLASGREHASMDRFQQYLGLDDFLVSSQGALVLHPRTGVQLWRRPLEAALAGALVRRGQADGFDVLMYTDDGIVASPESPWVCRETPSGDHTLEILGADLERLAAAGPLKVLWYGEPARVGFAARAMSAQLRRRSEVVLTAPGLLEFNAPDATKAHGVAAVARHYGVARADVVAFGDSHNDIPLLRWAGLGIAMPHGHADAHAAANVISPDADPESALAAAIDALLRTRSGIT